jgi:uncharacterized protein YqeY
MLEDRLNQDLKQAMLSGDKFATEAYRTLKSVILYAKVSGGTRDKPMEDELVVKLLQKEATRRQESADLYIRGGAEEKAHKELLELKLIEKYLPPKLSAKELILIINTIVGQAGDDPAKMGEIIRRVKEEVGARASGGDIARLVRERLSR